MSVPRALFCGDRTKPAHGRLPSEDPRNRAGSFSKGSCRQPHRDVKVRFGRWKCFSCEQCSERYLERRRADPKKASRRSLLSLCVLGLLTRFPFPKFSREFPGGLVVRTRRFQVPGPGSVSGLGTGIPCAMRCSQTKTKKTKQKINK